MGIIGILIKVLSKGPILFKQARIGLGGQPFTCLKFRTMQVNASTANHEAYLKDLMRSKAPMVKMDDMGDPRLIPLGAILRASGLDELPQLFNVLRGEMSIVGPRPCTASEYQEYQPWQKERFDTLPGLTGWWQVKGKNKTTFEQMIQLDIEYVRRKSLWFDLKIMVLTVPVLCKQVTGLVGRKLKRLQQKLFPAQQMLENQPVTPAADSQFPSSVSSVRTKETLCKSQSI